MDRGAWWATGSQGVGHNWSNLACMHTRLGRGKLNYLLPEICSCFWAASVEQNSRSQCLWLALTLFGFTFHQVMEQVIKWHKHRRSKSCSDLPTWQCMNELQYSNTRFSLRNKGMWRTWSWDFWDIRFASFKYVLCWVATAYQPCFQRSMWRKSHSSKILTEILSQILEWNLNKFAFNTK